jgi:hypothetical protein
MKAIFASLVQFLVFCSLSIPSLAQGLGGSPQKVIPQQKALQNIVRAPSEPFFDVEVEEMESIESKPERIGVLEGYGMKF